MPPIHVDIRLFGSFRRYASGGLTLDVPRGTVGSTLRRRIAEALRRASPSFDDDGLLALSVVADEHRVLEDADPVGAGLDRVSLAILPPVCGG